MAAPSPRARRTRSAATPRSAEPILATRKRWPEMLKVRELKAFYGASQALFGMELAVDAGEVVTLMGRNGMGKTTTVNAIMGLLPAQGGVVEFEGARVDHLPSFRIARLGLGLVPEGRQIFPNLSVGAVSLKTKAN